jgi:hypothetical protein
VRRRLFFIVTLAWYGGDASGRSGFSNWGEGIFFLQELTLFRHRAFPVNWPALLGLNPPIFPQKRAPAALPSALGRGGFFISTCDDRGVKISIAQPVVSAPVLKARSSKGQPV